MASRQTNVNISTSLSSYQEAQRLAEHYHYFHWEIEFPEVFRDEFGNEFVAPRDLVTAIKRIVYVSVESARIIDNLPAEITDR